MKTPTISIIAAVDEERGIGEENKIPWDIPDDRKWFKEKTFGHVVIMGKNTHQSILDFLGKPLSGRINIVVTSDKTLKNKNNLYFVEDIDSSLTLATKLEKNGEIFFIGGAKIYNSAINFADRLYLALVKGKYNCDTFFPDYSGFKKTVYSKKGRSDKYKYEFKILEKS